MALILIPPATSPGGGGAVDSVNSEVGVVVLDAGDIPFTPGGTISAADLQAALAELASETSSSLALKASSIDLDNTFLIAIAAVPQALYDANSILAATADNTPVALTIGASTIVGRKATGGIVALTDVEFTALVKAATTAATGAVELATSAETITGTDAVRAVTPASGAAAWQRLAQPINAQVGTTYTLVAADVGKLVTLTNGSAIALTLPQDSDATIAIGCYVDLAALGAGQVTTAAGTGATMIVSGLTAKTRDEGSRFGVQKIAANTWQLFGDLAAS